MNGGKASLYRERKNSGTYISGYSRRYDCYLSQSRTNTKISFDVARHRRVFRTGCPKCYT